MTHYRYGRKIKRRTLWYMGEIEGTEEEKMKAAEIVHDYTVKLLDYSSQEDPPSKEEIDELRRIYAFSKQGPRAYCQRFNKRNKLTSADVLSILSSSWPSGKVGALFGMEPGKIRAIRRGEYACWEWEYDLVRRLKGIIALQLKRTAKYVKDKYIFIIHRLNDDGTYEPIAYCASATKAKMILQESLGEKKYNKLLEEGTLDILYKTTKEKLL